jgi:hypothetical protein
VWTPLKEIKLFEAVMVHKPAGLVKHFNMALIHHKLSQQGMRLIYGLFTQTGIFSV